MSTSKLVWEISLRGGAWAFFLGGLFGTTYSLLDLWVPLFFTGSQGQGGPGTGPTTAAIVSMAIILGIGGGIVGSLIGLFFGPLGGIACGLLTGLVFARPRWAQWFPPAVLGAGTLYGGAAALVGLWYMSSTVMGPPNAKSLNAMYFYGPALPVGAIAGYLVSRQIARWYLATCKPPLSATPAPAAQPVGASPIALSTSQKVS